MTWTLALIIIATIVSAGVYRFQKSGDSNFTAKRGIQLVSLQQEGDQNNDLAEWVAQCLSQELGLEVEICTTPIYIPNSAFHPQRGQADAVTLVQMISRMVNLDDAVLGLTEYDLHSPVRSDLSFAMGSKLGRAGLISSFRMADQFDPKNTEIRLTKMVTRYGAELACDAKRNRDPTSILYEELQRPEQLDMMIWPPQDS